MWEQASCLCSAYSLQPKTEKERAKQQPQVWPVCRMPGLLSGWQPPTHQGYTAVIPCEEMLEIPNSTDRAHVTWKEEGKKTFGTGPVDASASNREMGCNGYTVICGDKCTHQSTSTKRACCKMFVQIWTIPLKHQSQ